MATGVEDGDASTSAESLGGPPANAAFLANGYRDEIASVMWALGVTCENVMRYCALGDDAGLGYSLKCSRAYLLSALGNFKSLEALKTARSEDSRRSP